MLACQHGKQQALSKQEESPSVNVPSATNKLCRIAILPSEPLEHTKTVRFSQ